MPEVYYNDYSSYLKQFFSHRAQKISIDAGFTCPNRDGSKGRGGCSYCDNKTFSPFYCSPSKSITTQLNEGIAFFAKKYKTQEYLAYFQSYTNTYDSIENLKNRYDEALAHPQVVGIVVSTRPDCVSKDVVELLASYTDRYFVSLEIGIESTNDNTLKYINRQHTYADTKHAFSLAKNHSLHLGGHLIIGLPNETHNDIITHAKRISQLPIETLKLHQLQIIKGTAMADDYKRFPERYHLFSIDEYIEIVGDFLHHLRDDIVVERFSGESPQDKILAPRWGGIKNYAVAERIKKYLAEKKIYQGGGYYE